MKKLLLLLFLMSTLGICQAWKTTVTTGIDGQNIDKMESFTNKDGIHVLLHYQNYSYINYFLLNPSGTVVRSTTIESNGNYPKLIGDNNKIFVLYKTGDYIRVKMSTNAGQSWSATGTDFNMGSIDFSGLDAAYKTGEGIHFVYSDKNVRKTYYYLIDENSNYLWTNYKDVTDTPNDFGSKPSIALSENRVHISYNTSDNYLYSLGNVRTRDKYLGVWQTPQAVVYTNTEQLSVYEKLLVRNNQLFLLYAGRYNNCLIVFDEIYKTRMLDQTNWSSRQSVQSFIDFDSENDRPVFRSCLTADNTIYSALYHPSELAIKTYDGTAWSNYTVIESSLGSFCYDVTNASNDVFLLWKNSSINCLQMKQYDAIPFKVQHPQVGNNPGNNYIRLIWDKNNEPDITNYEVSRKVNETGSIWQVLGTTSNNYYIDNEYLYTNPYGDFHLTYRIRAKDLNNQYSTYSDEATSRAEGNGLFKKATLKLSTESTLNQNFPNPFNPSTEIEFTIRKASQVKLTVYDVLGNEVAVLVNGMKNPGNYRAQFDGNKLASGIYIYKLVTSEQQIVRKMLLAK